MALVNCPECGNEISDKAQSCPKCGYPIACIIKKERFKRIFDPSSFSGANITNAKYTKLSLLRKLDVEAFAYAVKAIELLYRE